ncbi:hypothetical protein V8C44DRAFT_131139 [Trichoderma aethiopicum]
MHAFLHVPALTESRLRGLDARARRARRATLALGWTKPCLPLTARAVHSVRRADRAIPAARILLGSWSVRWAWGQLPAIVAMTCLPSSDPGPGHYINAAVMDKPRTIIQYCTSKTSKEDKRYVTILGSHRKCNSHQRVPFPLTLHPIFFSTLTALAGVRFNVLFTLSTPRATRSLPHHRPS